MSLPSRALIVAAGRSSRLRPLTEHTPKALLEVGGETMLARSVRILRSFGITDFAIAVGFGAEQIERHLGHDGFTYILNPFYSVTNNLASLWLAREWAGDDGFLYLHSDLVYAPELIGAMASAPSDAISLLTEVGPADEEAMKVRLVDGRFTESSKSIPLDQSLGEWVGIAAAPRCPRLSRDLFRTAEAVFMESDCNAYDTVAFTRMAGAGAGFHVVPTGGLPWVEVDDAADLEKARRLFTA